MAGSLCAVDIYPGTSIQSVVNSNSAGTTYVLKSGVHRLQTIVPKTGDVYQGESGTILSGAQQLATFSRSGSYWVASGQTQRGTVNTTVLCQSGWDGCQYPEQFYIDDVPLQHVTSLSAVTSGKWYFDYNAGNIYFIDDPTNRKVETSVTSRAFLGNSSSGVKIQNLIIEKYASPSQDGPISPGVNWTIQNSEVRLNQGIGVRLQNSLKLYNNYIHHNGQIGVAGDGDSIVMDGNELSYNNTAHFNYTGTNGEGGGTKFAGTTNLVVQNNYVHDNGGPALWLDGNNYGWLIQSNRTANNLENGIFNEINYDGTIRYNVVENEGTLPGSGASFWYKAAILVASSPNCEIYGNLIINGANGIGAIANNRGSGNRGTFTLQNLYVHDNTIVQSGGYVAGIVADTAYYGAYTSQNNRFVNNTYKLTGTTFYSWKSPSSTYYSDMTSSDWTAAGEDTTGTWLSSSSSVPSTQFSVGSRVNLSAASAIRSLPTSTASAVTVANLVSGSGGAVTGVRGPIYSEGDTWWHISWDSGVRGWVRVSSLTDGGGPPPPPPPPPPSGTTTLISSVAGLGSVNSTYTDYAGMQIQMSTTSQTLSQVGFWCQSGDNTNHLVKMTSDAAGHPDLFAAVSIPCDGVAGFHYANVPAGITLAANTIYYVLAKGTPFYNRSSVVPTSIAAIPRAVSVSQTTYYPESSPNATYGPLDLKLGSSSAPPPADTTKPWLGIAYPYNNTFVTGVVAVSGLATDNVGVVKVEWYVDGVLQATNSAAPYGFSWNTAVFSKTTHTLLGLAYDAAGNVDGGEITVTVY